MDFTNTICKTPKRGICGVSTVISILQIKRGSKELSILPMVTQLVYVAGSNLKTKFGCSASTTTERICFRDTFLDRSNYQR